MEDYIWCYYNPFLTQCALYLPHPGYPHPGMDMYINSLWGEPQWWMESNTLYIWS